MKNSIQKTLPADFGATVWRADRKHLRVVPMKVHSYHLVGSRRDVVELVEERSDCEVHTRWKVSQFGKTLFTGEEEARAALADHQKFYIVRGDRSGVFFGRIVERHDREVTLTDCRRVWYWDGAASLSQLAAEGVKVPQNCRIAVPVQELTVLDAIELLCCTDEAVANIKAVPEWKR